MKHERCWPSRWWLLRSIGLVHRYFSLSFCSPFLSSHISWINPPCNFSCHVSQQFSLKQTPAPPLFSGLLSLACYLQCRLQSRRLRFYDHMMWEVAARNRTCPLCFATCIYAFWLTILLWNLHVQPVDIFKLPWWSIFSFCLLHVSLLCWSSSAPSWSRLHWPWPGSYSGEAGACAWRTLISLFWYAWYLG